LIGGEQSAGIRERRVHAELRRQHEQLRLKERDQVSILTIFYSKLLFAQIPKAQKKTVKSSVFFALFGSAPVKSSSKMLVKSTPGCRRV